MTKTLFIERDNGNPADDKYLIAIDAGYSAVKTFSPNGVAMFPSYAIRDPGRGTAGVLPDDYIQYQNLETGEKWIVGKTAQNSLSDEDTNVSESILYGRNRYGEMFNVLLDTGLGMACMSKKYTDYRGKTIYVETGLPPRYMGKGSADGRMLRNAIGKTHRFSLQIGQQKPEEFRIEIQPEHVTIIPQPMGTLFSVAVNNEHGWVEQANDLFNKNVLIVDGGFGTLDLYPIKDRRIQESETDNSLGMKRVLEEAAAIIQEKYDKDISVPAMQKYLERGSFVWFEPLTVSTRTESLSGILEEASEKVCHEAIDKIMRAYNNVYEYDYLVVTGGTGAAWINIIREYFKNMTTLKIISGDQNDTLPCVFANVRGYYMHKYSGLARGE